MYLKSIEVHGFKSFANKNPVSVPQRNHRYCRTKRQRKRVMLQTPCAGCWASSESSSCAAQRCRTLFFSGTELRKPLGYALWAITLDNSDHQLAIDYDEVTVARRLYRSGESEYLINGTPCRLKDVNELFYDTGIGKEGYSIIGQRSDRQRS